MMCSCSVPHGSSPTAVGRLARRSGMAFYDYPITMLDHALRMVAAASFESRRSIVSSMLSTFDRTNTCSDLIDIMHWYIEYDE